MANLVPKLSRCPVLHIVNDQKWTLKGLVCRWEAILVGTDQPCWWWLSVFTWLMYTQVSFLPLVPCGGWYSSGGHRPHGVSDEAGEGSRWNLCWYWGPWPADTGDQGLHTAVFHKHIWYCDHIAVFEAPYWWIYKGILRSIADISLKESGNKYQVYNHALQRMHINGGQRLARIAPQLGFLLPFCFLFTIVHQNLQCLNNTKSTYATLRHCNCSDYMHFFYLSL